MKITSALCALAAASCGQATDNKPDQSGDVIAAKPASVGQLLRDGKPQACAHPAVQQMILERAGAKIVSEVRAPSDFTYEDLALAKATLPPQVLSGFRALAIDPQTGEIRCQVNIATPFQTEERPYQFVLRPLPDAPDQFILDGDFSVAMALAALDLQTMATDLARSRTPEPSQPVVTNVAEDPTALEASTSGQSAIDSALRNADAARDVLAKGADTDSWERPSIDNEL